MAVVRFADRVRRWGEGASTSGCWVCGEWVSREDTAVGLDIGMMGYALAHIPCANRLSLWLLEDVAHSGYSFTAGIRPGEVTSVEATPAEHRRGDRRSES